VDVRLGFADTQSGWVTGAVRLHIAGLSHLAAVLQPPAANPQLVGHRTRAFEPGILASMPAAQPMFFACWVMV